MPDNLIGYRFGEEHGADPREACKKTVPWSIRNALRLIGAMVVDDGPDALPFLEQVKTKVFKGEMTSSQMAAARKFMQGMSNYRAMDNLTKDLDGERVQRQTNVTMSYADLVMLSLEKEKENTFVSGNSDGERDREDNPVEK